MRQITSRQVAIAAAFAMAASAAPAVAQTVHARLQGYQEVPAVSSPGGGEFRAKIDRAAGTVFYELEYAGLQGTATMAHIHIGQHGVNGGISVWLCQSATNPAPAAVAASVPTCPGAGGNVNGTFMASGVIGPAGQLVAAGEFDELVDAIRGGVAYVNVHSTAVPAGEVRGQIGNNGRHGGH